MDVDYQNRTVLKIITSCKFGALMSEEDPRAENIMKNLYVGKEANMCDGNIYGYSTFMHILSSKPKKAAEEKDSKDDGKNKFMSMITIDFAYKVDVDYTFQHRYRSKAINFYFLKEMFFGLLTCLFMLYIYFDYLDRFRGEDVYFKSKLDSNGTVVTTICKDTVLCYYNEGYDFSQLEPR